MNLTDSQKEFLKKLISVFLEENSKINLSSLRDEKAVWNKHIIDSLSSSEFFENQPSKRVLDIGTGGGFPFLPLALLFPQHQFFGMDSVRKKIDAISRMIATLHLDNSNLLTGRMEEFGRNQHYREQFDSVTARAVAPFLVTAELATPFVKTGGLFLAYRGPEYDSSDEKIVSQLNIKCIHKKEYSLPEGEKRVLWVFEKTGKTPSRFPREIGVPKKNPLS
ncbi:16S rRNA (guanine(527)-N(7))-methyltransferase RsmG [Candidatus Peregrinibacteria bacterium]|nr:MAG: 16S rRNA (guanine(527)-N(7))-methyltransferase RsmG [Candidatus Peregrinibacteria bacterium]